MATDHVQINPISKAWMMAVTRFCRSSIALPDDLPDETRLVLNAFKHRSNMGAYINSGVAVADDTITAYLNLLNNYSVEQKKNVVFINPDCFQHLRKEAEGGVTDITQEWTKSKPVTAGTVMTFDAIIIVSPGDFHFVPCVVKPKARTVEFWDSIPGAEVDGARVKVVIDWIDRLVNGRGIAFLSGDWRIVPVEEKRRIYQASDSNDCGPIACIQARAFMFGKTVEHIPKSDKDALETRGSMYRSRILAEVIAGRINPKDNDIPKWLQHAKPKPTPPKVPKPSGAPNTNQPATTPKTFRSGEMRFDFSADEHTPEAIRVTRSSVAGGEGNVGFYVKVANPEHVEEIKKRKWNEDGAK
ncbi:hypothetical protein KC345_g7716 [Hortaea werneckii]|nr:hypothetical protein KC345_g7716 [Hortaea werneckii]